MHWVHVHELPANATGFTILETWLDSAGADAGVATGRASPQIVHFSVEAWLTSMHKLHLQVFPEVVAGDFALAAVPWSPVEAGLERVKS